MAKDWAKNFYNSKAWMLCKNAYIEERRMIDGGMCEECQDLPGYIVHHKITLTADNIGNTDVSLNHDLLEYVCKKCHDRFEGHGLNKSIKPLCRFDENGQPISLREIDNRRDSV